MSNARRAGWQIAMERVVLVLVLIEFCLLTVIDGARNPVLYLWFAALFTILLGVIVATCPGLLGNLNGAHRTCCVAIILLCLLAWLQATSVAPWRSVDPWQSWLKLYLLIGYGAAFALFAMMLVTPTRLITAATVVVVIAIIQTVFGVINLINDTPPLGWAPTHYAFHRVTGTFVNRNFYAGLVAMSAGFPLVCLLTRSGPNRRRNRSHNERLSPRGKYAIAALIAMLLVAGMMMSGSRSALLSFAGATVIVLLLISLDRNIRLGLKSVLVSGALGVGLFFLSLVGQRFSLASIDASDRLAQWRATIDLLTGNLMTGTGAGTYQTAFSARQTGSLGPMTYNHAHNDALQLIVESGIPGLLFVVILVGPILIVAIRRLFQSRSLTRKRLILGALFGVMVMLLQSLVDFPFQVPANSWLFILLMSMLASLSVVDFRSQSHD